MKIAVMCCTLNEERNIKTLCEVYSRFVDHIVICDGGSTDRTIEIARTFPKVLTVLFDKRITYGDFEWNPKGAQHNAGLQAALHLNPSWIITDECDSLPTVALQRDARGVMETTRIPVLGVQRIYMIGADQYFPNLSLDGHFGWAFRPGFVNGRYCEEKPTGLRRPNFPSAHSWYKFYDPYVLMHNGWPDEETVQMKTARYKATGRMPEHGSAIPDYAGEPEPLPEWATWS